MNYGTLLNVLTKSRLSRPSSQLKRSETFAWLFQSVLPPIARRSTICARPIHFGDDLCSAWNTRRDVSGPFLMRSSALKDQSFPTLTLSTHSSSSKRRFQIIWRNCKSLETEVTPLLFEQRALQN